MHRQTAREIALQVLRQAHLARTDSPGIPAGPSITLHAPRSTLHAPRFIEELLEAALARARLAAPDVGLCHELVFGVVRWQATLDWIIARKTQGRPQKSQLQDLLRLGLYQIFWLDRVPDHAAVNETVSLARQRGFGPQAGFVNALLRGCLREREATISLLADLKRTQPALGYSHPEWLVARWQQRWGHEKAAQLMDWNNTPPKTFARVNNLKTDAGKLLARWREEDVEYDFVRRDWLDEAQIFQLKSHPPLTRLRSFQQGWFYIQDPSTLLAVRELGPKPGETVLDLCAAPGGKLAHIGELMQNQGRLVAHDIYPGRLKLVQENCARLGIACALYGPSKPSPSPLLRGEARGEGSETLDSQFDRILVDAPCSNTGVMRRRVDLRWRLEVEELRRLSALQLDLLRQAAPRLKPGGTLLYSTCSLEPEENEQVISQFLQQHPAFHLERTRELLPFSDSVDGAFIARLTTKH